MKFIKEHRPLYLCLKIVYMRNTSMVIICINNSDLNIKTNLME